MFVSCVRATRVAYSSTLQPKGTYFAQDLAEQLSLVSPIPFIRFISSNKRGIKKNQATMAVVKPPLGELRQSQDDQPRLLYEGPFASLTLRLKRLSLTSAVIGMVGLPILSVFYGNGSVPSIGQFAVITTTGLTAIGSTALLGYCFSPYVHCLERLPVDEHENNSHATRNGNMHLFRITTRDIFTRRVETTFDPTTDISPPSNSSRPFCNFMVKDLPMYVHPEMINDHKLRALLVGEGAQQESAEAKSEKKDKSDDDELF